MARSAQIPDIPGVALINVGIQHALADEIAESTTKMPWAVHRADYEGYISAEKRPAFPQFVKSCQLCIAVIDFDKDIDQAFESASYIQELYSGKAAIVAHSANRDHNLVLDAMRAGCNDFIVGALDTVCFATTLARINEQWTAKAALRTAVGSVLTFFGVKGGVGTTTLAVHLAMYLVRSHKKRVLLIDNHPQLGHSCIYLGIDGSRYNFHELVENLGRLDSELLRGYIATHSSGLEVLASPDTCSGRKATDSISMAQTLDFLRGEYDYVILDCPTALDDTNLAAIEASNQIYLVATPEIGSIRDLSRYVDVLSQNQDSAEKLRVVINRFSTQHTISIEQIEKTIQLPIAYKLPKYAEVERAGLMGEPINSRHKSEFSAQILKWASTLTGEDANLDHTRSKPTLLFEKISSGLAVLQRMRHKRHV